MYGNFDPVSEIHGSALHVILGSIGDSGCNPPVEVLSDRKIARVGGSGV